VTDEENIEYDRLLARIYELETEVSALDAARRHVLNQRNEARDGEQDSFNNWQEAEGRIGKALAAADSVKGTYSHPDQLEQAVFEAFWLMKKALRDV
jgi:hypothetical protein